MYEYLSTAQISEWEAYDRLDPIGDYRSDFNTAQLMSLIYNISVQLWGKEGEKKMSSPSEFMVMWGQPEEKEEPKVQSLEQLKATMMSIAEHQNAYVEGKVRRRDNRSLYRKRKNK